jgi:hypothetical protein
MAGKALNVEFTGTIEQLSSDHDRRSFTCGVGALDEYLRRFARQHAATNISRTYVAVDSATIRGYYSLAMAGIRRDNLPVKHSDRSRPCKIHLTPPDAKSNENPDG